MPSTYDTAVDIIAETCEIPRDEIAPDSHLIDDLGLDSLELAELAFAVDRAFGVTLPIERWKQDVDERGVAAEDYVVLKNLCDSIDRLVAAKQS
ncbi:MAG: hypothetical protein QOD74_549 [Variibacter sp.]|jgi:acyl carrier protein|nr:hypothetical protein [Variibacter sp.]